MAFFLQFLLLFNWFDYKRLEYNDKQYPMWADMCGWVMACIPIVVILSMAIWKFVRTPQLARSQQDNTTLEVSMN